MLDLVAKSYCIVQFSSCMYRNHLFPSSFCSFSRGRQQHLVEVLPPPPTLFRGPNTDFDDHVNSRSGVVDESHLQRPEFGQVIEVDLSPSTELYWADIDFTSNNIQRNASRPRIVAYSFP